jgi:hypothetical protein
MCILSPRASPAGSCMEPHYLLLAFISHGPVRAMRMGDRLPSTLSLGFTRFIPLIIARPPARAIMILTLVSELCVRCHYLARALARADLSRSPPLYESRLRLPLSALSQNMSDKQPADATHLLGIAPRSHATATTHAPLALLRARASTRAPT